MNTDDHTPDRQALNDPTVSCCGRDAADCDCTPYDLDTVTRGHGDIGDVLTDRALPYGEWNIYGDPTSIYAD